MPSGDADRFLVAGPAAVLVPLLDILTADRGTEVLSVSRSGAGDPRRLVVRLDPARAEAMAVALGGLVTVEPDIDVTPA